MPTKLQHFLINVRHLSQMILSGSVFSTIINWPDFIREYFYMSPGKKVTIVLKDGTKFKLRANSTDKWSIHEIILRDDYNITRLTEQKPVILDLGAAEGVFTVYALKKYPNGRVIALEPTKENYNLLKENVSLNRLDDRVTTLPYACSSESGFSLLYLSVDKRAHSLMGSFSQETVTIHTISLPDLFAKYHLTYCDFMKIDIEGSEYDIFYHLPFPFFKKIKRISMECHNLDKDQKNGAFLTQFLKKQGYSVEYHESLDGSVGQLF